MNSTIAADPLAGRLFWFGFLDGPQRIAVSRNGRLTISPARTDVARFIHRAVRLARSHARLRSQPLRDYIHEYPGFTITLPKVLKLFL
jgi:hypothetical protein